MSILQGEGVGIPPSEGLLSILLHEEFFDAVEEKAVQQGLKSVRGILTIVRSAFSDLLGGKGGRRLDRLDGLVTDCACQVRAIENLVFEKKIRKDEGLSGRINSEIENISEVVRLLLTASKGKRRERKTLRSTLFECAHRLSILSDVDVKILVLSKMLFEVKREVMPQEGFYNRVCTNCPGCGQAFFAKQDATMGDVFSGIFGSAEYSQQVVNRAQSHLARISSKRLLELIREANIPIQEQLTERLYKNVERGNASEQQVRRELPASLTIEAVLQLAAAYKIPVLMKSKLTEHAIEASSAEGSFDVKFFCDVAIEHGVAQLVQNQAAVQNGAPFLVIAGLRSRCASPFEPYEERMRTANLAKAIRENAANHFQYTDGRNSREQELQYLRDCECGTLVEALEDRNREGRESGCVQENARMFVTVHIYPSSLEEEQHIVPKEGA